MTDFLLITLSGLLLICAFFAAKWSAAAPAAETEEEYDDRQY
jgi:hypothetical protein